MNNIEEKLLHAVGESNKIISGRFLSGHKDMARGTLKLEPLHGCIGNELQSRVDNLIAVAKGIPFEESDSTTIESGKELECSAAYIGSKRVDIALAKRTKNITPTGRPAKKYSYDPVACILSKCVFANYSQNSFNYFQNQLAETLCIRKNGCPVGTIFLINHTPSYHDKHGNLVKKETFGRNEVIKYDSLFQENPLEKDHRSNAMLLLVFDLDASGNALRTSVQDLGFDSQRDAEIISRYQELSNVDKFFRDMVNCIPMHDR
jgi:hypothetical protein